MSLSRQSQIEPGEWQGLFQLAVETWMNGLNLGTPLQFDPAHYSG